jgi:hypothetical protein
LVAHVNETKTNSPNAYSGVQFKRIDKSSSSNSISYCDYTYIVQAMYICPSISYCMNWLAFYILSYQNNYQTCFVKVLVENGTSNNMEAISHIGNSTYPPDSCCSDTCGETDLSCIKCPSVNDTVALDSKCLTVNHQAVCLEVRPSGQLYSCPGNPTSYDETLITIKPNMNGICRRTQISNPLMYSYGHKVIDIGDTTTFKMYLDSRNHFTNQMGIFCVSEADSIGNARNTALQMCRNGSYSPVSQDHQHTNDVNWAVKFEC